MTDDDISALVYHNIISPRTSEPGAAPTVALPRPSQSALEIGHEGPLSMLVVRDVFLSVIAMAMRLRRQRLKDVLRALIRYRTEHAPAAPSSELDQGGITRRLVVASAAFNRIRPYVPVTPRCLIDSLSLVAFLAKRRLPAQLVIAVACDPFSAHAWVQHGSVVLNDTAGNAWNHMPIRVI